MFLHRCIDRMKPAFTNLFVFLHGNLGADLGQDVGQVALKACALHLHKQTDGERGKTAQRRLRTDERTATNGVSQQSGTIY